MVRNILALAAMLALGLGSGVAFAGGGCSGAVHAGKSSQTVASADGQGKAPSTPIVVPKTDG